MVPRTSGAQLPLHAAAAAPPPLIDGAGLGHVAAADANGVPIRRRQSAHPSPAASPQQPTPLLASLASRVPRCPSSSASASSLARRSDRCHACESARALRAPLRCARRRRRGCPLDRRPARGFVAPAAPEPPPPPPFSSSSSSPHGTGSPSRARACALRLLTHAWRPLPSSSPLHHHTPCLHAPVAQPDLVCPACAMPPEAAATHRCCSPTITAPEIACPPISPLRPPIPAPCRPRQTCLHIIPAP